MRNARRIMFGCLLIAACVGISSSTAKPGTPAGTVGPYQLIFAGAYVGEGRAVVTGSNKISVIMGNVTEVATGATGKFKANNLALDDGHFTGAASVLGQSATVCGRVEAADGKIVVSSRIMCTYLTTTGAGGRAVGKK